MVIRPDLHDREVRAVLDGVPPSSGMVNRLRSRYGPPGTAHQLLNVDLDDLTTVARRGGRVAVPVEDLVDASLRIAAALDHYPPDAALRRLYIAQNGGDIYHTSDLLTWLPVTGGPVDVLTDSAVMFPITDGVYVLPRAADAPYIIDAAGAISQSTGLLNVEPPLGGVDGCFAMSRAWILTVAAELHFSKPNPTAAGAMTDWCQDGTCSGVGGRFLLSPYNGGRPVACRPWNRQSIIVFFDRYIEEVIVEDWNSGAFNLQTQAIRNIMEPRYGTSARSSVVSIGQEMFFLDQYGEYRSLVQTVNAQQAGVTPLAVSEPIKKILPGRLTHAHAHKSHAMIWQDKLYLWVPLDGSTECNARLVLDLGRRIWTSLDVFSRPSGHTFTTRLRSGGAAGEEMYDTDGSTGSEASSVIYRTSPLTHTDDGAIIPLVYETQGFDAGMPECDKLIDHIEVEVEGDNETSVVVDVRMSDGGAYHAIPGAVVVTNATGSYPLVYPLAYPIYPDIAGRVRRRLSVGPNLEVDGRGRMYQFRFRETGSRGKVQIVRWHAAIRVQPMTQNVEE